MKNCNALKLSNYNWNLDIVLAVDTSWMGIGIIIYQVDPEDPKKWYYAKFNQFCETSGKWGFLNQKEIAWLKESFDTHAILVTWL